MYRVSNFEFRFSAPEWRSLAAAFFFDLILFVALGAAALWLLDLESVVGR